MNRRYSIIAAIVLLATTNAWANDADKTPSRQVGQMVLEGIPEIEPALKERMQQYMNARSAAARDIAPDGSEILIATRFADTYQLHIVKQPMGMREQITFFDEPVGNAFFLPGSNAQKIVYGLDKGGNEKRQYFLLDRSTNQSTLLTLSEGRTGGFCINRDGSTMVFSSTAKNGKDYDIYAIDLKGDRTPKLVWETGGYFHPSDITPDGTRVLVHNYVNASQSRYFLLDLTSGRHVQITPEDPPHYYGGATWSTDGNAVYLVSDREGQYQNLYRLDMQYGQWTNMSADIPWDVTAIAVEPTGKGVAFTTNEGGINRLYFADTYGKSRKQIDALPVGLTGWPVFAADGGELAITINTAHTPSDVYHLTYPEGTTTRWTKSEVGGMDTDQFVDPKLIRYPTFDQVDGKPRMIPAFYYPAPQPGPRPVVIYAHGGPESQFSPGFASLFQYWALELGISVIAPNIRGSVGYGTEFHRLDDDIKREDSIKDIGKLLDWIEAQPELDASRVGIYGGSYGGYVVLASLATYPDRFKAGVDSVGIASFITFLENTGEFRQDVRRAEYGDERDPKMREFLTKISPLNNADKIKAALFVTHGKNDPRVPYTEAEQIVKKVRELGGTVWYALALNEGHGFRKKENADLKRLMVVKFWEEHLLK